jgi:hypothetical protein
MGTPDPCRPNISYQRIVAIYNIKYLQSRVNYYSKNNLHSTTLRGYVMAVNMFFELQKYGPPINFNNNNNMAGVIISNIIKEGNFAKQQAPPDNADFAKIQQWACDSNSNNPDSDHSLLADAVALGQYIKPK